MEGLIRDMGPALAAMGVTAVLATLVLLARRLVLGPARGRRRRSARARHDRTGTTSPRRPAGPLPARRIPLDLDAIHRAIPDFDLEALIAWVHARFHEVQQLRGGTEGGDLARHLLPGALDVATASGAGLQGTGRTWIQFVQPIALNGSSDGCHARFRIRAWVEERRHEADILVEIDETWTLGWPPAGSGWRVLQVERAWRRRLDPPVLHPDAEPPARQARVDPRLGGLSDRVDLEGACAAVELVVPEWAAAFTEDRPDRLEGLVTPAFREAVRGASARYRQFGRRPTWRLEVDSVTPVRALLEPDRTWVTTRVVGRSSFRIEGEGPPEELTLPWSRYLTLCSAPGGRWLLAWAVEDEDWPVQPALDGPAAPA